MSDSIQIQVRRWSEYNPRKDFKSPRWFALNNRILEDSDFYQFDGDEFKSWIYILCQCSQKNSDSVVINFSHALRVAGIPKKKFQSAISKLQSIEIIQNVQTTNASVHNLYSTLHNKTEQNITNRTIQNTTEAASRSAEVQIHEFLNDPFTNAFLEKVGIEVQESWVKTYEDAEWIKFQVKEAVGWIFANKSKAPKSNFAKFFTSWLSRSWEWKRKNNLKVGNSLSVEDLV